MKAVLALVVCWVMTMVTLLVLDWLGLIDISGKGEIFGISFKGAGAAFFVVLFMALLVFLLGKIRLTREPTQKALNSLGF